jgi:hypothetical protein
MPIYSSVNRVLVRGRLIRLGSIAALQAEQQQLLDTDCLLDRSSLFSLRSKRSSL